MTEHSLRALALVCSLKPTPAGFQQCCAAIIEELAGTPAQT